MPEIYGALVGAAATALVMVISNMSSRRERDIRDIYFKTKQVIRSGQQNRRQDAITCAMFGKTTNYVQDS